MQLPDAEQLIAQLASAMRPHITPATALVGIHTGGVWLAQRLHALLGLSQPLGSIDVSFYRDDYGAKGLHPQPQKSEIPFDVEGAHIVIVDDVLYTGRTTRAALNELFDYGRPARVDLAVLIDRGGRELPIAARFCALTLGEPLPAGQNLQLERDDSGALTMRLIHA
ncbi:MAG: bifunctional pyr operon transcriptional regulator/uracil phosphoribosyltransferase PyrR [Zoogloea sp.]|nr:bifunctional pyr operon transcriptional regulator/uracil phosphoribosyltransferase PyrR [Zoogloea sp.]